MESEDDESLAGLTQSSFLEPPLVRSCELLEDIFEAPNFGESTIECVGLASEKEFNGLSEYRRPEQTRKISLVTDEQVQNIKESRIPTNTKSNTNWAVGVWDDWARERNARIKELGVNDRLVNPDIVNTTDEELRYWMAKLVVEIRKKGEKGEHYPPATLYQLCCGLLRFLRNNGRPELNIFEDPTFKRNLVIVPFMLAMTLKFRFILTF